MDILNSGSFVPLDNREKIEQLIFTAKTLATEVSRMEGFQSSGPTNHQLGLEMWKGAEYMCRAHEEATIRNIFLSKFLERLREIERQDAVQATPVQHYVVTTPTVAPQPVCVPAHSPSPQADLEARPQAVSHDEYLGVVYGVAATEVERPSYADECVPEGEREIVEFSIEGDIVDKATAAESVEAILNEATEPVTLEPPNSGPVQTSAEPQPDDVANQTDTDPEPEPARKQEAIQQMEQLPTASTPSVESIVLAENEPYNFDSCTITTVVQLLPVADEKRKCVISVRTHDFTPLVTITELPSPMVEADLSSTLQNAISQYISELPARAADKLKKEKSNSKKRPAKPAEKPKPLAKTPTAAPTTRGDAIAALLPAASSAGQSSLFGS